MSAWQQQKHAVLEAVRHLARKGLVVGTSGNVSMRLSEPGGRELVGITPTACRYDALGVDDIVVLDFNGARVEGHLEPSIEKMLHIGVYKRRSGINAVIHTHPVFGCAFAVAGLEIPPVLDEQVACLGGEVRVADYAPPGSTDLVENVLKALGPRNAVLMANHGALAVGRDMQEALTASELLERAAMTYIWARVLGRVNPLPPEAIEAGRALFAAAHGQAW
ncbi:MAG: class II aldolase/adducin family protein [Chloroflexi bacterium]|nr:MAG: class II aldolase/adducin family protein [Chloroflexota bacterium]RLC96594.1 MAG: class II aldolase/adducin family protein [Chloroflexota bacterium]